MEHKWKKLVSYYKPYRGLCLADTLFAIAGAGISLAIPLIVRYITSHVAGQGTDRELPDDFESRCISGHSGID